MIFLKEGQETIFSSNQEFDQFFSHVVKIPFAIIYTPVNLHIHHLEAASLQEINHDFFIGKAQMIRQKVWFAMMLLRQVR